MSARNCLISYEEEISYIYIYILTNITTKLIIDSIFHPLNRSMQLTTIILLEYASINDTNKSTFDITRNNKIGIISFACLKANLKTMASLRNHL